METVWTHTETVFKHWCFVLYPCKNTSPPTPTQSHPSPAHCSTPTWPAAAQPGDTACQECRPAALLLVLLPKLKLRDFIIVLSQKCLPFQYRILICLKSDWCYNQTPLRHTLLHYTAQLWALALSEPTGAFYSHQEQTLNANLPVVTCTKQTSATCSISAPIYCSRLTNAGRAGQSQPCATLSTRKYC